MGQVRVAVGEWLVVLIGKGEEGQTEGEGRGTTNEDGLVGGPILFSII